MTNKYKLVPIEPTIEMLEAEWMVTASDAHTKHGVAYCAYKAMLEAAPTADVQPVACQYAEDIGMPQYRCQVNCQYPQPPADKDAERMKKLSKDLLYELKSLVNSIDKDNPILLSRAFRHAQATIDKAMEEV